MKKKFMDKNRMKKRALKEDGSFTTTEKSLLGISLVKPGEWCKDAPNKDEKP